jgi:hypothetical protein
MGYSISNYLVVSQNVVDAQAIEEPADFKVAHYLRGRLTLPLLALR